MLFYTNLILHQVLNNHSVDDILYRDGMADKEEEKDFATLLIEWYSKQKKAAKTSITSDKGDNNDKEET